jgi:hypothetical protein
MTKCAWCESAIEDGQSRVQLSDGTVYHMDPCRVLVLEREITQLRQQLATAEAERDHLSGLMKRLQNEKCFTCDCGVSEATFDAINLMLERT